MLNADPLDPEYQAKIAQDIQQKNIEENMEAAIEYTPESFSRVVMLYLEIKVNGVPVQALVDSGARSTIMSRACAERCNIMRLVDRRWAITSLFTLSCLLVPIPPFFVIFLILFYYLSLSSLAFSLTLCPSNIPPHFS